MIGLERCDIGIFSLIEEIEVFMFNGYLQSPLPQVRQQRQHRRGVILLIAVTEYQ